MGKRIEEDEERRLRKELEKLKVEIIRDYPFLGGALLKPKIVALPMRKIGTLAAITPDGKKILIAKEFLAIHDTTSIKKLKKFVLLHEVLHAVFLDPIRSQRVISKYRSDIHPRIKHRIANLIEDAVNNTLLSGMFDMKEIDDAHREFLRELLGRIPPSLSKTVIVKENVVDILRRVFRSNVDADFGEKLVDKMSKEEAIREALLKVFIPQCKAKGSSKNGDGEANIPPRGGGAGTSKEESNGTKTSKKNCSMSFSGADILPEYQSDPDEIELQEGDKNWQQELEEAARDEEKEKQMIKNNLAEIVEGMKKAGYDPLGVQRLISELKKPILPWRRLVRTLIRKSFGPLREPTWKKPNRRCIEDLPGKKLTGKRPSLIVALDTSGSISNEELKMFLSEVRGASMARAEKTIAFCWDADAYDYALIRGDYDLLNFKNKKVKGGGGTRVTAAVEKAEEIVKKEKLRYPILVIITDGCWSEDEEELVDLFSKASKKFRKILIMTTEKEHPFLRSFAEEHKISFVRSYFVSSFSFPFLFIYGVSPRNLFKLSAPRFPGERR